MSGRRTTKYFMILTTAFFTLGAFSIIYYDYTGRKSSFWPTTTGKIVETSIEERLDTNVEIGATDYKVFVRYAYAVGGKEYTGFRIRFTGPYSFMDMEDAQRERAKFPVNKKVDVYYDPDDPESSCLEPGGGSRASTAGAVLAMLVIIGICIFGIMDYGPESQ